MSSAESDRVATNVAQWTKTNAEYTDAGAERCVAERTRHLGRLRHRRRVAGDVAGLDVVELGCGTAFFAARLARMACTGRRCRPDAGSARHRPADDARRRASSSRSSRRRPSSVPAARQLVRPRGLRLRRVALGRSAQSGSPRPRACCVPAAGCSSSPRRRSRTSARPRRTRFRSRTRSCARCSLRGRWSGPATKVSSFTSRTGTGSAC